MATGILGNGTKLPMEWNRNILRNKSQLKCFSSSREVINAIYSVKIGTFGSHIYYNNQ